MLACSIRSLQSPSTSRAVFDRTPLDYLAYLAANGADPAEQADASTLRDTGHSERWRTELGWPVFRLASS